MRFAEIAVDAPAGHSRTFSYSIPDGMTLAPGCLVRVPFGRRTLQGVVMSLEDAPQVSETKDVLELTFDAPVIDEIGLSLAQWVSEYYICPLFDAAALMLPPGGRVRPKTFLSTTEAADLESGSLTPPQHRALEYVQKRKVVVQEQLLRSLGEGMRMPVNRLVEMGMLERRVSPFRPSIRHKQVQHAFMPSDIRTEAEAWLESDSKPTERQAALVRHLFEESRVEATLLRKSFGPSAFNALVKKKWLKVESVRVDRDPLAGLVVAPAAPVELTPGQAVIAREIRRILEDAERHPRTFLVQGVTGSGKTEIYLDATEKCLALGKRAIVLVPEIALTHQTIERFAARFPGQVAVQHSGLSDGERHDQWWRIKQGDYGIVIGSRGAVFAPQPDLGLIVLDEEHEWTYKQQDASPRYHARSVAERLSEMTGAVVLMGSASPDVGTYYRGLLKDINLFLLADRFAAGSVGNGERKGRLASVHLVDMREELKSGNREMFSRKLFFELEQCIASGDQAVLFINRRGSASSLQCRNCGFTVRCRRCDITMTLHRQPDRLLCHYCGDRRAIVELCPRCLTFRMSFYGFGTETVLGELQRHFSDASAIRWDRDTVRTAKDYETALNRFRSGEAQVLVGTQMIAKGLHFPNVTLVGVVSADVGLHIPDFSAAERTFQIVCQVAGRSGRGERPGTVVVQTYQPENYAVQSAAAQDYQAFYRREMAFRRRQADPPYSKLIRLLYAHRNAAQCEGDAIRLSDSLREQRDAWGMSDVDLLGPVPAFPARLRGMYRWQIVLRGPEPRLLLDKASVPTGWQVDMDPVSLS